MAMDYGAIDELRKCLAKIKKADDEREARIPQGLEIQKRKFLCAIGKAEPSLNEEEDEKFIQECTRNFCDIFAYRHISFDWNDKFSTKDVKNILDVNQNFDLKLYLDCAKAIFLTYSGKNQIEQAIYKAFTYVITHARSFGDPTQNIFQLEDKGSFKIQFGDLSNPLSDSVYMKKITALIRDLHTGYDEVKYMMLNANVTYLTLLILRRFVKNDTQFFDVFKRINTHDDYVKLCPYPLNNQLPRITEAFNKTIDQRSLKNPVILAIHAFLTVNDAITKRVLRATCIYHIEWTGLQVPFLFFKVVKLYGIEEAELWDSLSFKETNKSLFNLADDYYKQYKMSKADPPETVAWFPYCRALNGSFHKNLSAPQNKKLCIILAYLVDLKMGLNNSFVRKSHWALENNIHQWTDAAKELHKKFNAPRLA